MIKKHYSEIAGALSLVAFTLLIIGVEIPPDGSILLMGVSVGLALLGCVIYLFNSRRRNK